MRRVVVLFSVLFVIMVLTGCADGGNAINDDGQQDVDVAENGASNEGKNDVENESSDADEVEEEAELTIDEAQEIVFDHFLARLVEMDELMAEVYEREDYQLVFDNSTKEYAALEREIAKTFRPLIGRDSLREVAEYYAEMYTCECDSYPRITPNMVNVNFEVVEQDADTFLVRFNELGDEMDPSYGQYMVMFVLEDEVWKYAEAEYEEHTNEAYGLRAEDVANYGFDYSTNEIVPMEYIDTRTIDGKEVLVFESYGYPVGYEVDTGAYVYIEE